MPPANGRTGPGGPGGGRLDGLGAPSSAAYGLLLILTLILRLRLTLRLILIRLILILILMLILVLTPNCGVRTPPCGEHRRRDPPFRIPLWGMVNTANLRTKTMDFRMLDSSIILMLRGGIPRPIGNFLENSTQTMLVGVMLVRRLGVDSMI